MKCFSVRNPGSQAESGSSTRWQPEENVADKTAERQRYQQHDHWFHFPQSSGNTRKKINLCHCRNFFFFYIFGHSIISLPTLFALYDCIYLRQAGVTSDEKSEVSNKFDVWILSGTTIIMKLTPHTQGWGLEERFSSFERHLMPGSECTSLLLLLFTVDTVP